ncbi:flagellar hook-basal body complex protein FliE [Alphaproteobacteria bacterium]|nr:flagellar hook-basal body complex protein FliE [Alphaproteobacteria bacterium]
MKPRMTTITPDISNTQETVKNLQENIINTTRQSVSDNTDSGNFLSNIEKAIQNVSDTQKQSAEITKNFELGFENDLTKVMIQQQLSSLGFQMTLNVRNKVLSAYKDIMNMPV